MNLDIIPNGAIKRIHVSQNDIGRTLTFELFNNSTSYTVPSGAVVKIQGTKPSGLGFSETCTVNGNVATIDTTEAMTDESGNIQTELSISYGDVVIGTSNFVLAVERNPHPSNTTDGTQITAQSLQVQINELADTVDVLKKSSGGQPKTVESAEEMTDVNTIYLYLGNEEGYDYGYIYVYDDGAWTATTLYGKGEDGATGYSPTVTLTEVSDGVSISVTDKNGTTTATVQNGTATDEQVSDWLDAHPEATTTVQDGAITSVKLADKSVTTAKIADNAVTMGQTDFYYSKSAELTGDWFTKGYQSNTIPVVSIPVDMVETASEDFPDIFNIVAVVTTQYWTGGKSAIFRTRTSSWSYTNFDITHTTRYMTVNGTMYGIMTVAKSAFSEAYANYVADIENNGKIGLGASFTLGNNAGRFTGEYYVVSGTVTEDLILSGFKETSLSEDFATAVLAVLDSGAGTTADEEKAKLYLSGKVMVCLGDSFTRGMDGLLSTLATKYEMVLDNRGIVSSSICGDVQGTKGFSPMWNRANTIVNDYSSGYTIDGTSYTASNVAIITFMGGANDGFGLSTWIGGGINETDTNLIYGALNHIFNVLQKNFPNAILICITQPSSYNRTVSSIADDATAQTLGFDSLAQLQVMDDIQFSNYAMALKENAVKTTAWSYGVPIVDMFHDFPSIFNPSNRTAYWNSDKLHLTSSGYQLITDALEEKMVQLVLEKNA